MLRRLWYDECGAVVSAEIVIIGTVVIIALLAAWVVVRNALFVQISEQAEWIAGGEHENHEVELEEIPTCDQLFGNGG